MIVNILSLCEARSPGSWQSMYPGKYYVLEMLIPSAIPVTADCCSPKFSEWVEYSNAEKLFIVDRITYSGYHMYSEKVILVIKEKLQKKAVGYVIQGFMLHYFNPEHFKLSIAMTLTTATVVSNSWCIKAFCSFITLLNAQVVMTFFKSHFFSKFCFVLLF